MSLVSIINDIVTAAYPDSTYILSSRFRANVASFDLESEELPLIVLNNELVKNVEIKKNSNIQKDTKIVLWFLDQDSPDNNDTQINTIQQSMELIADRIAFLLYRELEILPSGNQRYLIRPLFNVYSSWLSGVELEMNVNYYTLPTCS